MTHEIDKFFNDSKTWQEEMEQLRMILLDCGFTNLKSYLFEAIEVEKAGLKVILKKTSEYPIPEEFQHKLNAMPALKKAFAALTPGRQRAYLMHFSAPKQTKTRETRIESYLQKILNGKGITDCTCGLSKRYPTCDGSHKLIK